MNLKKIGPGLRSRLFALISVVAIVAVFGLNLLIKNLALGGQWFIDLTREGLYTLTPEMKTTCDTIFRGEGSEEREVKVIFCADPDTLTANTQTRVPYFLALALAKRYDNFKVETVNVTNDPTAVALYKRTSLTQILPSDVIVTSGSRYRVTGTSSFWYTDSSTGAFNAFNGEFRMVTLISSILAIKQPAAYFITGHGETVYDKDAPTSEGSLKTASLRDLLTDCGMEIKLLDVSSVDAIPDDCALLILNDPQSDFTYDPALLDRMDYRSDLEKIDRYLVEEQGAMIVAKDYRIELPCLEDMLREWGFSFGNGLVKDSASSIDDGTETVLVAKYETDTNGYAYNVYKEISALSSAPITVVPDSGSVGCSFGVAGGRAEPGSYQTSRYYSPYLSTSSSAKRYAKNEISGEYTDLDSDESVLDLAAVGVRYSLDSHDAVARYSYVFCAASGDFFSEELLGNGSYANYDIASLLVQNVSRVDIYASTELGGDSYNAQKKYGGKLLIDTAIHEKDTDVLKNGTDVLRTVRAFKPVDRIAFTVILIAVPLGVAIAGAVICLRRKFL